MSDVDRARSRGPGKSPPEVAARRPALSARRARDRCAPKAGQWTESGASVHDKATSSLLKGTVERRGADRAGVAPSAALAAQARLPAFLGRVRASLCCAGRTPEPPPRPRRRPKHRPR